MLERVVGFAGQGRWSGVVAGILGLLSHGLGGCSSGTDGASQDDAPGTTAAAAEGSVGDASSSEGTGTSDPDEPQNRSCAAAEDFELFVVDYELDAVLRYDGRTGAYIDAFLSPGAGEEGKGRHLERPYALSFGPEGNAFVANFGPGSILEFDGDTGAFVRVLYFDTYFLEEPMALEWIGEHLVVVGNDSQNLVVLNQEGELVRTFGEGTVRYPIDMALGPDELLYVTSSAPLSNSAGEVQIWALNTLTHVGSFEAPDGEWNAAVAVTFDCLDRLYLSDAGGSDTVLRLGDIEPQGRTAPAVDEDFTFDSPGRLEMGPDGLLYVSSVSGVYRVDPEVGEPSLFVPVGRGGLRGPRGLTVRAR